MKGKIDTSRINITVGDTVRLTFDSPELEDRFQRQFHERHRNQNRIAISFGFVLYALFGFVDSAVGGDHWRTLLLIRLGLTLPLVLLLSVGFFVRRLAERYTAPMVFLALLATGISLVAMNTLLPRDAQNLYFTGLLIVLIFGLGFFRTDFHWPAAAVLLTFVIYLVVTWAVHPLPFPLLLASIFYYVTAMFIMTYTGWFLERKERQTFLMEQRLLELAHTDELTGLANRRALLNHLNREWRRALRDGDTLALLLFDLDHLKRINDTHGHSEGDAALQRLADALAVQARRPGDMAARLGGDEFVLLLHVADPARVRGMAIRLAEGFGAIPLPNDGQEMRLTASVGLITAVPTPSLTPEILLQQADEALYEAKQAGRARAVDKHVH